MGLGLGLGQGPGQEQEQEQEELGPEEGSYSDIGGSAGEVGLGAEGRGEEDGCAVLSDDRVGEAGLGRGEEDGCVVLSDDRVGDAGLGGRAGGRMGVWCCPTTGWMMQGWGGGGQG